PLLFDTDKKIFEKCKDTGQYLRNNIIRVRYAEEKENGDVYLATENNGLVRYNYINGRFTEFPSIRRISGVCRHFILDQGKIWAGTEDGLVYLDPVTGKVLQHLTTENGLSDNVIYGVLMDDSKQLWVSTNKGICKIDQKLSKVTIYSMEDGLQDLEFNTAVAYKFTNGNLLFGGINGFNIIKPVELKKINFVPTPLLVDLKVLNIPYSDSVPYPFLKNISLKFNQNFITMGFQSPVFTQINRINYRYMLSNLHETWINNGSRNYVNFTQLKPGNYTFKVQAFDDNKVYSGINEIYITIHAPWYYNFWFLFFSSMAIVTSSLLIISARIKALKVRKSLLHQKAVAEMQSLRLQMNPHFIFNSLNSINSYIVDNKTLQASDYLSKFSRLMRLILENSRHETITLSKELEYVSLYLLIESLRFAKAFEYEIHVDESVDAENLIVPPLFIQPFLENSIWHGLMPRKGTRTLNLDLTQSSDILTVVVSDNGVGREYSAKLKETKITLKNSHGMDITKNRIMYHNPKNTVQIEDLYNALGEAAGTRVVISIHYI
ncbi:MAG TPA: histidine kinase, partial [Saprospiraceae bacterium]|nr:histidine kinase [Saprospiraceae bacterium]